jgi:hypothetical protein
MPYALSLPLPPCTSAGWLPTCVFVKVNEAQKYLAISIDRSKEKVIFHSQGIIHHEFIPEMCNVKKTMYTYILHHLKGATDDEYLIFWNLRTDCYSDNAPAYQSLLVQMCCHSIPTPHI